MNLRAFAAVGLRVIGVWFFLEAVFGLFSLFLMHRELMAGMPGIHRRYIDSDQEEATPKPNRELLGSYYAVTRFAPGFIGIGLRLAVGSILLLASKPLARLLVRKLDTF